MSFQREFKREDRKGSKNWSQQARKMSASLLPTRMSTLAELDGLRAVQRYDLKLTNEQTLTTAITQSTFSHTFEPIAFKVRSLETQLPTDLYDAEVSPREFSLFKLGARYQRTKLMTVALPSGQNENHYSIGKIKHPSSHLKLFEYFKYNGEIKARNVSDQVKEVPVFSALERRPCLMRMAKLFGFTFDSAIYGIHCDEEIVAAIRPDLKWNAEDCTYLVTFLKDESMEVRTVVLGLTMLLTITKAHKELSTMMDNCKKVSSSRTLSNS